MYGKIVGLVAITIFHGSPCSNRSGSHSMRNEVRYSYLHYPLAHWIYYKPDLVWVQTQGRLGDELFPNTDGDTVETLVSVTHLMQLSD